MHDQLALVYFLEYVAAIGAAAKANPDTTPQSSWAMRNSYEVLSLCYQVIM